MWPAPDPRTTPASAVEPASASPRWWKNKRFIFLVAGFVAIGAIGVLTNSSDEDAALSDTLAAVALPTVTVGQEVIAASATNTPSTVPPTDPPTATQSVTTESTSTPPAVSAAVVAAVSELAGLTVADPDPVRPPYIRDDYDGDGWADFDGDCISTRHELLITYSLIGPTLDNTCFVDTGQWIDPYDGAVYTSADQVTIDHVVALAEAHRSGAWKWDTDTKIRFANDETPGHLVVVGGDINQSKADKTPDQWMPPNLAAHCQYAIDWASTKARYGLTVTAAEHAALETALETCAASSNLRPLFDGPLPLVVITIPTTITTTTIAPTTGPGVVALLACDRYAEVVTIINSGGAAISLSGYKLHDQGEKHSTSLGGFGSLQPAQQLRIVTGPDAVAGDGQVVWKLQNVWNNDGDIAFLVAPDGTETTTRC